MIKSYIHYKEILLTKKKKKKKKKKLFQGWKTIPWYFQVFQVYQGLWSHLMFLDALMISLILGTPRVMFMEATPAKWNVLRVIWVPGSPMLWAHRAPTAEPGSICALSVIQITLKPFLSLNSG